LLAAVCALALTAAAPATLPRTSDGHPDLQGIWANDTVTMLERADSATSSTRRTSLARRGGGSRVKGCTWSSASRRSPPGRSATTSQGER